VYEKASAELADIDLKNGLSLLNSMIENLKKD
jgi:hypothetical protein